MPRHPQDLCRTHQFSRNPADRLVLRLAMRDAMETSVQIVADSREPREYCRLLDERPRVERRIEKLGIGDHLIGPDAVIERKTGADFA